MMLPMELLVEEFMRAFHVPGFVRPYLHLFAGRDEMQLVVSLNGKSMTAKEIASLLQISLAEMQASLEKACWRGILKREIRDGETFFTAATFYERLDSYAKYGNYHVIPKKVRRKLDKWCFEEYLRRNGGFNKAVSGEPGYEKSHSETVLLLQDVEKLIDSAASVRVLPCNCKMLADNCDFSREVCLELRRDPGEGFEGRELSREEAKKLLRRLDREGLMHIAAPPEWNESACIHICNCCICCCYPLRAAQMLGTKGRWPKSLYTALYHREKCLYCGLCVKRCPNGAFYGDGKSIAFDPDLCWGCGVCANACPGGAITMERIPR